jgi:hypothetical protein
MLRRSTDTEDGYFLTDAVVGLFVLASVAGGLMAAFGTANSMAGRAERTAQALVIVRSCLERPGFDVGFKRVLLEGIEFRETRTVDPVASENANVLELVKIVCATRWSAGPSEHEVRLERIETRARRA